MNAETSREDQLVAGLCHLSVLLPLFGAAVPLGIWLTQRARSPLLRFQALQALVYHVTGVLMFSLIYACQMIAGFGSLLFTVPFYGLSSPETSPAPDRVGLGTAVVVFFSVLMLGGMLVAVLECIGAPLFAAIGVWGAWRVLAGRDFRYPLLGRWVAARLNRTPPAPAGQELPT